MKQSAAAVLNQRESGTGTHEFATSMHALGSNQRKDDSDTIIDITNLHATVPNLCMDVFEKRTEEASTAVFGFQKTVYELATITEEINIVGEVTSLHVDLLCMRADGSSVLVEERSTIVEQCSVIVDLGLGRKARILGRLG